ncbi:glycosyltransferase family 4 protein [Pseudomonas sp. F1_0610]|uniref:MraY family glycosyltransferase n=1 Tax=Pseudomonas sp. F1_0610 TaxID=3114284 RepID=UPI0039C06F9A
MTKAILFIICCGLFLAGYLGTYGLRRLALAKSIIDIPNERSSHTVATPRGGGVAIVLSFIGALFVLFLFDFLLFNLFIALLGAGVLLAVIGFLDDLGHVAARWRLLGHFSAAIWGLYWLQGFPPLIILGMSLDLSWAGYILAAVYSVWLLNLYNFMDGIDGLASIEAMTSCLSMAFLYWLLEFQDSAVLLIALASSVLGFLVWNFPPAKIFMGDAGSGFLGIILALLSIQGAWLSANFFWCWIIVLGVFIVDATFTLLHRLWRKEKVYEAHRSHAYQYAARQFNSHKKVTLAVLLINLFWLLPLALVVGLGYLDGMLTTLIAYIPLISLAVYFKAGVVEKK